MLTILTFEKLACSKLMKDPYEIELLLASNAPVICIHGPRGAGDTGDIVGVKCRILTSDVSWQCRGCAGF